jgi:arginine-tRNA-protein transferase
MFTEELYELYARYEKAVHKKDRERDNLKRFLCNSPVYDFDKDIMIRDSPSLENCQMVDETFREFKDEGVFPGHGTFHMYHRIDGKLVALSVIDILKHTFVSCYCIYDPDLSFLCLGVIAAIREFEYVRLLKQSYVPTLKYYQLGEMVISCPKVNYKLNYKPGLIICPRTKKLIPVDDKSLE